MSKLKKNAPEHGCKTENSVIIITQQVTNRTEILWFDTESLRLIFQNNLRKTWEKNHIMNSLHLKEQWPCVIPNALAMSGTGQARSLQSLKPHPPHINAFPLYLVTHKIFLWLLWQTTKHTRHKRIPPNSTTLQYHLLKDWLTLPVSGSRLREEIWEGRDKRNHLSREKERKSDSRWERVFLLVKGNTHLFCWWCLSIDQKEREDQNGWHYESEEEQQTSQLKKSHQQYHVSQITCLILILHVTENRLVLIHWLKSCVFFWTNETGFLAS